MVGICIYATALYWCAMKALVRRVCIFTIYAYLRVKSVRVLVSNEGSCETYVHVYNVCGLKELKVSE